MISPSGDTLSREQNELLTDFCVHLAHAEAAEKLVGHCNRVLLSAIHGPASDTHPLMIQH